MTTAVESYHKSYVSVFKTACDLVTCSETHQLVKSIKEVRVGVEEGALFGLTMLVVWCHFKVPLWCPVCGKRSFSRPETIAQAEW